MKAYLKRLEKPVKGLQGLGAGGTKGRVPKSAEPLSIELQEVRARRANVHCGDFWPSYFS